MNTINSETFNVGSSFIVKGVVYSINDIDLESAIVGSVYMVVKDFYLDERFYEFDEKKDKEKKIWGGSIITVMEHDNIKKFSTLFEHEQTAKKVFISQPMRGLTNKEIIETRTRIENELKEKYNDDFIILSSFYVDDEVEKNMLPDNQALECLGKSIALMAEADLVYFVAGWEKARGCYVENLAAKSYNKQIIEENIDGKMVIKYTIDDDQKGWTTETILKQK